MAWRQGFHLMPPAGWLNDPNALCQFDGTFHVCFQYWPNRPSRASRGWGHWESKDLVSWTWRGTPLMPDSPTDWDGAFSGSAYLGAGGIRIYYTGNVKEPGEHDMVNEGRGANQILVTSEDGETLSAKECLLTNEDYPSWASCHVRDPKLWNQDGLTHMVLGARDRDSRGALLVYASDDGRDWKLERTMRSRGDFGFMWECPDRLEFDGREWLAICPQGMDHERTRNQNVYSAGYVALPGRLLDCDGIEPTDFREWDHGFDFYAPQTFVDEGGRTILMGWMGLPDVDYTNPTTGLGDEWWEHCLTVPRVITAEGDHLLQWPVAELDELRGAEVDGLDGHHEVACGRADVCLQGIADGSALRLEAGDDACVITYESGELALGFEGTCGYGRGERHAIVGELDDLRVLVDTSSVEVFANGGETVMTTRWYPQETGLVVRTPDADVTHVFPMADVMSDAITVARADHHWKELS
ncbi:MAG: glycoside hydrolase family 32 protein [Atopobiaceae bacterium]|nr:glycoside hydrolase family 32 protein [Atopobiaceae bacterium]